MIGVSTDLLRGLAGGGSSSFLLEGVSLAHLGLQFRNTLYDFAVLRGGDGVKLATRRAGIAGALDLLQIRFFAVDCCPTIRGH